MPTEIAFVPFQTDSTLVFALQKLLCPSGTLIIRGLPLTHTSKAYSKKTKRGTVLSLLSAHALISPKLCFFQ